MTTEEKAKAYDEALERAKKFEEKYGGGYAGYIFPELAESEDERIRKELKEAFEAYDIESTWNGIPIRSIFAWLEKQKEQKPVDDKAFEEWIDGWWKEHKEKAYPQITMDEKEFKNFCRGIRNMYAEQKSVPISCSHENGTQAEWSEEDEEKLNNISEIIEHCTTIPYSGGTLTLNKFR